MSQMFFNEIEAACIAQDMEKNGLAFYQRAAGKSQSADTRTMFLKLAEDEKQHLASFTELEASLRARDASDVPAEDVDQTGEYIAQLLKTQVFGDSGAVARLADAATRDVEVIAVAMTAERDSIVFYREMIDFVDSKLARDAFASILKEERRHLVILGQRSQQLDGRISS